MKQQSFESTPATYSKTSDLSDGDESRMSSIKRMSIVRFLMQVTTNEFFNEVFRGL